MKKKQGWHMTNDTPDQIAMCLNCQKPQCTNCIDVKPYRAEKERARYLRRKAAGYKRPSKRKTYTVDGKIITEKIVAMLRCYPTFTTDKQISEACGMASCSVCEARQRLGLPAATASVEEKTRLVQHYLDEVQRQRDMGVAG